MTIPPEGVIWSIPTGLVFLRNHKSDFVYKADADGVMRMFTPGGTLTHKTLGTEHTLSPKPGEYPYHWDLPAITFGTLDADKAYYLYATVPDAPGGGRGVFRLESDGKPFYEGDNLNLLVGILNSEYGGERSFAPLYGFTEILPGRITTDRIVSADGSTFFDLENAVIGMHNEDGKKMVELRGEDGSGLLAGGNFMWDENGNLFLSSNISGQKITIDPVGRAINFTNSLGKVISAWRYHDGGALIDMTGYDKEGNGEAGMIMSVDSLRFNPYGDFAGGSSRYAQDGVELASPNNSMKFSASFILNGFSRYLNVKMIGLPTSSAGLESGTVWRDGTTLKIVP